MHQSAVMVEKEVFDTAVPAQSAGPPQDAITSLAKLRKAKYPVSLFRNNEFWIYVQEEFEHIEVVAASVGFVLTVRPYSIKRVQNDKNNNDYMSRLCWHKSHVKVL